MNRPAVMIGSLLLVFALLVALFLLLLPTPYKPFEYMLAGTAATALTLVALFLFLLARRRPRD
jgi:hypothetical protein